MAGYTFVLLSLVNVSKDVKVTGYISIFLFNNSCIATVWIQTSVGPVDEVPAGESWAAGFRFAVSAPLSTYIPMLHT